MKINILFKAGFLLAGCSICQAGEEFPDSGGAKGAKGGILQLPESSQRWRFGSSVGIMLGVDAQFSSLGRWVSPNSPTFGASGVNRTYDDGFNNVDISGNAGNLTWNWGYQNPGQAGANLTLSTFESARNGSVEDSDDPSLGFNFFGLYDMGDLRALTIGSEPTRWGVKMGFGYQRISIENSGSLTADLRQRSDTFALNGVIPPLAPYTGSSAGPGPLVSDTGMASQRTIQGGAIVEGEREINADLFLLSVGPYLEFPITSRFSAYAEVGANLGVGRGDYSFSSSTSIAGIGTQSTAGDETEVQILGGLYAGVGASWALTDQWSLYGDVKYQYLSPLEVEANGSEAELNFDSAVSFNIGVLYRF